MGTKAKVKIMDNNRLIGCLNLSMDGYVGNWAAELVKALRKTTPQKIRKSRHLFQFLSGFEEFPDRYMDYICIVDISNNVYRLWLYTSLEKPDFEGDLDAFAKKYIPPE